MEGFAMAMIPAGFTDLVLIGVVPISSAQAIRWSLVLW